jgi:hypothetical protein
MFRYSVPRCACFVPTTATAYHSQPSFGSFTLATVVSDWRALSRQILKAAVTTVLSMRLRDTIRQVFRREFGLGRSCPREL